MAKPALQPDLISRALRAHMTLPVRTESAGHHRFLFVDHRQLQLLRTADWQVVFGRRGSGKTLLLHVLQEILEEEFERSRQIPVLLSAQDFLVSPVGFVPSDKVRALGYFQTFCEKLADDLLNRVISLLDRPGYLHMLRGKARKKRVEDLIVEIVALVQNGHSITAFNKVKKTQRSRRTIQTENGAAVGIGLDATGLRASGGYKAGRSREREEIHEREESEAFSPRFALVRDKLIELLDELDVERLVLLIDEWSVLDTSGSSGLQPEFAECLKRAFCRRASKTASNWVKTPGAAGRSSPTRRKLVRGGLAASPRTTWNTSSIPSLQARRRSRPATTYGTTSGGAVPGTSPPMKAAFQLASCSWGTRMIEGVYWSAPRYPRP